jgi:hypothetical protein
MQRPLTLDVARCLGWKCSDKYKCQRYLTMAVDNEHDYALRSYTSSLKLPEAETCLGFLEDKE